MSKITLHYMNAIESGVTREEGMRILPYVTWKGVYWKQGQFSKERKEYDKDIFHKKGSKHFYFYSGFIPYLLEIGNKSGLEIVVEGKPIVLPHCPPYLPPYQNPNNPDDYFEEFDDIQLNLIRKAKRYQRGLIKSPTGTGKTLLQLGVISCYPQCKVLLLAHTISLVTQTFKKAQQFGFKCQMLGGDAGISELTEPLVISTIQTFHNLNPEIYMDYFDIVIVDEVHHVFSATKKKLGGGRKKVGDYGIVLSQLLAPVRLGFTATLPPEVDRAMVLKGLFGELLGEMTIQEGKDAGLLVDPLVHIIKVPFDNNIHKLKKYQDVYDAGIVENPTRNGMITDFCKEMVEQGKTCLIMVVKLRHGENLYRLMSPLFPTEFVQGNTRGDIREQIKECLINRSIKCVITTAVWREGINIPSLDVVVNACGHKSEIMTLQAIGRGLRKAEGKENVIIVDFFDPSHYFLINHYGERMTIYLDNNWRFICREELGKR